MITPLSSAIVLAAVLAIAIPSHGATYEWTFNNGNLNEAFAQGTMEGVGGTVPAFATTNGTTIPHIGGVQAQFLSVPSFTSPTEGFNLTLGATGPNGNGAYVNQYTFIFDFFSPGLPNWQALFQTDPENTTTNNNDADWYVAPDGALGIGALGYSTAGAIQQETWYRIAFAADLSLGRVSYYIDGVPVLQSFLGTIDGRFALYSNVDPGADVRLFNEADGSGVYTHEMLINSIAFVDREMTAEELATLGAANAAGIFVPEPGAGLLALAGLPLLRRRRH